MTYREVEKVLRKNRWQLVRVSGSHYCFKKLGSSYVAVVPCHGGKDISIGVLKSLEKGTGLSIRR